MPKKYRIEMTILDDTSNTQLDTDRHTETYADDAQAKRDFAKKAKAAREAAKGSSQR